MIPWLSLSITRLTTLTTWSPFLLLLRIIYLLRCSIAPLWKVLLDSLDTLSDAIKSILRPRFYHSIAHAISIYTTICSLLLPSLTIESDSLTLILCYHLLMIRRQFLLGHVFLIILIVRMIGIHVNLLAITTVKYNKSCDRHNRNNDKHEQNPND